MAGGAKKIKKLPEAAGQIREQSGRLNSILTLMGSGVLVWLIIIFLAAQTKPAAAAALRNRGVDADDLSWFGFLLSLTLAVLILYLVRKHRIFGTFTSIIMAFLIFGGASIYLETATAFFLAVSLMVYERLRRSFASNNLLVLAAVLFGSLPLGLVYSVEIIVLFLIAISVYDVMGVFATRFIPRLAATAVQEDVPLLLLAPRAHVSWHARPSLADSNAILGAGDLFLPGIFLAAAGLAYPLPLALFVLAGAVAGGVANLILVSFIRTGIPAMPMLAAGMIAAYYLAI